MSTEDQRPPIETAYERYAAASAAHLIVWNNPKSTASERFASALSVHSAFHDFLLTNAKAEAA